MPADQDKCTGILVTREIPHLLRSVRATQTEVQYNHVWWISAYGSVERAGIGHRCRIHTAKHAYPDHKAADRVVIVEYKDPRRRLLRGHGPAPLMTALVR